jgi:hypothetical protein
LGRSSEKRVKRIERIEADGALMSLDQWMFAFARVVLM